MLFNIFSTLSLKKSTPAMTKPPDGQPKPTQPTATRNKKPPTFGRVLKALKSSGSKTQSSCLLALAFLPTLRAYILSQIMFFKLLSALTIKMSTAGTTQPTGREAKPAQPPATPVKKASALGRVHKALKSSRSKTKQRKYLPTTPPPLECFYTPNVGYDPFSRYPTFDLDDFPVAAPFLPNSTLAAANMPLPPPSRSPMTTPTTVDSGYLSASTPNGRLAHPTTLGATRKSRRASWSQNSQALRNSEVDRIWDTEEAKALAEEEKEEKKAKRRAQRFDLQVKSDHMLSSHDRLIQAGVQAKERRGRGFSNVRDRRADLYHNPGTASLSMSRVSVLQPGRDGR
ncbi:hypothetical protein FRC04_010633 [Tulasnella sp. 424]|nr:hypothetical protein FRC04_010633 [Tulasnella sp. 424]KAG8972455.1 hypothetical protein FRC05_010048 [Tulasnella sp. 425]